MRVFTRARLFGLLAGSVLFAIVLALQALLFDDDDQAPQPEPPSAAAAPSATASLESDLPALTPPAKQPPVRHIEGGFVREDLGPNDVPSKPYGIAFADVATGDGEFWYFDSGGEEKVQASYYVDPSHRWLQWRLNGDTEVYIADRRTGETLMIEAGRLRLEAGPTAEGLILVSSLALQPTYTVFDINEIPPAQIAEFELPEVTPNQVSYRPIFLADSAALLIRDRHVDLSSGEVTQLSTTEGMTAFVPTIDGGWLRLASLPDDDPDDIEVARFDASGRRLPLDADSALHVAGLNYGISPNGRWLYSGVSLGLESPAFANVWPAFTITNLATGVEFRVVRASVLNSGFIRSSFWLADSSGLVVATSEGFAVLTTDGDLQLLPFGPVEQSGVGGVAFPIPVAGELGHFVYRRPGFHLRR